MYLLKMIKYSKKLIKKLKKFLGGYQIIKIVMNIAEMRSLL